MNSPDVPKGTARAYQYPLARDKEDFEIPNRYNSDNFYRCGMRQFKGDKLHLPLEKESDHLDTRYRWSCEEITQQQRVAIEKRKNRTCGKNKEMKRQMARGSSSEEVTLKPSQYSHPSLQNVKLFPLADDSPRNVEYSETQSEHSMFTNPTISGPSEGEDYSQPPMGPSSLAGIPSLYDCHMRHIPHVQWVPRSPHADLPHGISPTAAKEHVIMREIHEHHHHYRQIEPKVTDISVVGATSHKVIVGTKGSHDPHCRRNDCGNDYVLLKRERKQVITRYSNRYTSSQIFSSEFIHPGWIRGGTTWILNRYMYHL